MRATLALLFAPPVAALFATATPASAERIPVPSGEFAVEGTLTADETRVPMSIRHRGDVTRIEMTMESGAMIVMVNLKTRRATGILEMGGQAIVIEVPPDQIPAGGNLGVTEGIRVGTSTLLGETCDEYETTAVQTSVASRSCVTRDGVPLRTVELPSGRPIWSAIRVMRTAQNPALFQLPPDATRLPAGSLPGLPRTK